MASETKMDFKEPPVNKPRLEISEEVDDSFSGEEVTTLPTVSESNSRSQENVLNVVEYVGSVVDTFRQKAIELEEEKDYLICKLDLIRNNKILEHMSPADSEEITKRVDYLMSYCQTVKIHVSTERTQNEEEALHRVNSMIDRLVIDAREDVCTSAVRCQAYANACFGELDASDREFADRLQECTLDDRKRIGKRLRGLLEYINDVCGSR